LGLPGHYFSVGSIEEVSEREESKQAGEGDWRGLKGGGSVKTQGRFIPVSMITHDNLVCLSSDNFHSMSDTGRRGVYLGK